MVGTSGARERSAFLEAEMFGNADQPFPVENAKLHEHAIDCAAQRRGSIFASERAGDPLLKERTRDAVARFEVRDTVAHRDHFAAAIGSDDGGLRCVARVAAGDHGEIPEVE